MSSDLEKQKGKYYKDILQILIKNNIHFLIGGGIAVTVHSIVDRPVKDLDVFIKAGDYPKVLEIFKDNGFKVEIVDDNWLAKIKRGKLYADLIFSSPNLMTPVDDSWFENTTTTKIYDTEVKVLPVEELIWCKAYIQKRIWYDGADVNHLILSRGKDLNWKHLLMRFESHWELFFSILLNFRFVYPSERSLIPNWLIEELMSRLKNQLKNPLPKNKTYRGPLFSRTDYEVDLRNGYELFFK